MTVKVTKPQINVREKLAELEPRPDAIKKHQTLDVLGNGSCVSLYTFDNELPPGAYTAGTNAFDPTKRKFGASSFKANNTNTYKPNPAPINAYPFSMSCWAYNENWAANPDSTNKVLLNTSIAGQRVTLCVVDWSSNGGSTLSIMYGGSNHWTFGGILDLPVNTWIQIVFSLPGSNSADHGVYTNGVKLTPTNKGGAHGGSAGWGIGGNNGGSEKFTGWIDQMRIFNRGLTPAEVQELYLIEAMGL
jgi:hypothetical protein|tara:strand:- start:11 stop:748 length:738 start_codon:yes stop_codon:yes gene_type:complete